MIAGLVAFDGGPADAALVARMIAPPAPRALTVRGPLAHGSAALAHCGRRRAGVVDQPAIDAAARCAIVFDGRIDNRDDLAAWLGAGASTVSDARLVLDAYLARGLAAVARLSGDFAFAIWDAGERRLLLVRDPLGVRQVCYAPIPRGIAFATDPRQLLEVDAVDRRANLGFFGEWLAGWITHPSDTIYRGIHRVPAAHVVTAGDGIRCERYWDIDPERRIRYRDDREYAQVFRELFASSVRARLRSADRVAIALSGGVDSSAIASMAAHVDDTARTKLRAYNVSYPGLAGADEDHYAHIVADALRIPLATIRCTGRTPADYLQPPRLLRDLAPGAVGATEIPFYGLMGRDGCELVLDGSGGDEWFTGTPYIAADLLKSGRVIAAVRTVRAHAAHCGSLHGMFSVAKGPVWAAIPPMLRRGIKRVMPAREIVPRLIRRDFAASINLAERMTEPNYDRRFSSVAAGAVYRDATSRMSAFIWHEDVRLAAAFGMEMSAPFQDRALAEFAAALPEEQRWAEGRAKRVVRRAMKDLIPAPVIARDDKGNDSPVRVAELRRLHGTGALRDLELAAAGIVDPAAIEPMFQTMCEMFAQGDRAYEIHASHLWLMFAAECAWRALFLEERAGSDAPASIAQLAGMW